MTASGLSAQADNPVLSKEYIRLGSRVIAIESYGGVSLSGVAVLGAAAGSNRIKISASQPLAWTTTSSATWLTPTTTAGTTSSATPSESLLEFTFTANDTGSERSALVKVSPGTAGAFREQSVTIRQSSGGFTVTPSTVPAASAAETTGSLQVTTSAQWTATSDAAWLILSDAQNRTGNGTLNYSLTQNQGPFRTGTISFTSPSLQTPIQIAIPQQGADSSCVTLSTGDLTFGHSTVGTSIQVGSTCNAWTATKNRDWLTLNKTTGQSGETLLVGVTYNYDPQSRTGQVTFTNEGHTGSTVLNVTQYGSVLYLAPSAPPVSAGQQVNFAVYVSSDPASFSNFSWTFNGLGTFDAATGIYRAPNPIPIGAPNATLTGVWSANPSRSVQATIVLLPTVLPPTITTLPPVYSAGTGAPFHFQVHTSNTPNHMFMAEMLFSTTETSAQNACEFWLNWYDSTPTQGFVIATADDGVAIADIIPFNVAPYTGNNVIFENSQCRVNLATSSVGYAGDPTTLQPVIDVAFKGTFAGQKNLYMRSASTLGGLSDRTILQTYNVTTPNNSSPNLFSLSPQMDSGSHALFTAVFKDTDGVGDLKKLELMVATSTAGSNACTVLYSRGNNALFLNTDDGTGWVGPYAPGSATWVENSQCRLDLSGAAVTDDIIAYKKTLVLPLTFKDGFSGAKSVYMYAEDAAGATAGWFEMGAFTAQAPVSVTVSPVAISLYAGANGQQFAADVRNAADTSVTWSLNPAVGTLTQTGLYTSPASVSAQQTVTVTATSQADPTKSASSVVTLLPVSIQLNITAATLSASQTQQFTATVAATNTGVTWSLNPNMGTINDSGLYTAPATIDSQHVLTVTATSQSDPSQIATATVTLLPITVSLGPGDASLAASQSQQFTATVENATNTAVTWSLNPNVGTLSTAGSYTAPGLIASAQTVVITAASVADPAKFATANVALLPVAVQVTPASTALYPSQTQQFAATVTNAANTAVTWSISPDLGTISTAGLYTAPDVTSTEQIITLTATSAADPSKTASAIITLGPPIGVSVTPASPGPLYASQTRSFLATVTNTTNTSVTWSVNQGPGTVGADGIYTAPAAIPAQQSVTVRATSVVDATKFADAVFMLMPPIVVTVSPASATLYASQAQQFTATVTNATNTSVTWTLMSGSGTVAANGLYTAPAAISTQGTATVRATSVTDTSKFAERTITLMPPITVSVSPASASLLASQTRQLTAAVANTTNTAVTWSINPAVGTITQAGLYTAPASVNSQQTVTVTATSQADGTKTGTAAITLMVPVTVTLTPVNPWINCVDPVTFTATVTGSANTAVTWSGDYWGWADSYTKTATTLTYKGKCWGTMQVFTVRATSVADPTKIVTVSVTQYGSPDSLGHMGFYARQSYNFYSNYSHGLTLGTVTLVPSVGTAVLYRASPDYVKYTAPSTIPVAQRLLLTMWNAAGTGALQEVIELLR